MSETSEFRRDDVLQGDDARHDDVLSGEGRSTDGGLTTEQLADAGTGSRRDEPLGGPGMAADQAPDPSAEQAAADPRERDAGGMPVTAEDQVQGRAGSPKLDSAASAAESDVGQLLDPQDREAMTSRWRDIQADFVDHPREAMKDADTLVAGLMQQLAQTFAQERAQLEAQWSRGDEVSTEDLRVSLQRYRAFFERLLSA
jgi:hypothetical protein